MSKIIEAIASGEAKEFLGVVNGSVKHMASHKGRFYANHGGTYLAVAKNKVKPYVAPTGSVQ